MSTGRDPRAIFEILVREHAASLMLYLRSALHDPGTIDDIFQETMLVAWRRLDDFDRSRPFGPWLRGIAHKLVLAHARKARRRGIVCNETVLQRIEAQIAHIHDQPGDTLDEKTAELADCLRRLPEDHRRAVELRYGEAQSPDQVAAALDITREALKKRLQRARSRLLDCLRHKDILLEIEV